MHRVGVGVRNASAVLATNTPIQGMSMIWLWFRKHLWHRSNEETKCYIL